MKTLFEISLKVLVLALLLLAASCTLFTQADSQNNHEDSEYWLGDASPNPVSVGESTTFEYYAKTGEEAKLVITNVLEQEVINLTSTGGGAFAWNGVDKHGRACGSGVYFYRLSSGAYTSRNKMLLIL